MAITVAGAGCGAGGTEPERSRARANSDKPALIAEAERRHDFGVLVSRPGRRKSHVYRLSNGSGQAVVLRSVINQKICCGRISVDRSALGPGESANIEVTLLLDGQFGDVVHETEVVVDRPVGERLTLRTTAVAIPALRVEPVSLPAGPVLVGAEEAARKATFRVFAAGDAESSAIDLDAVELRSTIGVGWEGEGLRLPPEEGVATQSRLLYAVLDSGGDVGARRAEILLEDRSGVLLRHVVDWSIVNPISVAPEILVAKPGSRYFHLILKSHDHKTFRVLSLDCPALGVCIRRPDDGPASTHDLGVKISPTSGAKRGSVSVLTDHPVMTRLEIPYVVLD